MSGTRPVWLTLVQRDQLLIAQHNLPTTAGGFLGAIIAAWDAAPADAVEAVLEVLPGKVWGGVYLDAVTGAVLRALGMPEDRTGGSRK